MSKEVEIRAIKPFNKTPQGDLCDPGDRFPVAETRADELERLGLAERVKAGQEPTTDSPAVPANKAGRKTANKG